MRLMVICALLGAATMIPTRATAQARNAAAERQVSWRNYRRVSVPFATDSTECDARATTTARGMSAAARTAEYQDCLGRRGWNPMRIVAGGATCPPVVLQPAGTDSASVAPLLTELTTTLTRRFRPGTPDDTAARLIVTVTGDDIRARTPGASDSRIPFSARVAVVGAKSELAQFTNRPGATPVEFVASFEPRCVSEFPAPGVEVPTQGAYFEFQVERPVRQLSGSAPAYPPSLREAHIQGRVLAQFVVDTSGVPDMRSFKVLTSSHELFSQAVREALPAMRFAPATVQGRKVRQVVQQPFTFAM